MNQALPGEDIKRLAGHFGWHGLFLWFLNLKRETSNCVKSVDFAFDSIPSGMVALLLSTGTATEDLLSRAGRPDPNSNVSEPGCQDVGFHTQCLAVEESKKDVAQNTRRVSPLRCALVDVGAAWIRPDSAQEPRPTRRSIRVKRRREKLFLLIPKWPIVSGPAAADALGCENDASSAARQLLCVKTSADPGAGPGACCRVLTQACGVRSIDAGVKILTSGIKFDMTSNGEDQKNIRGASEKASNLTWRPMESTKKDPVLSWPRVKILHAASSV